MRWKKQFKQRVYKTNFIPFFVLEALNPYRHLTSCDFEDQAQPINNKRTYLLSLLKSKCYYAFSTAYFGIKNA